MIVEFFDTIEELVCEEVDIFSSEKSETETKRANAGSVGEGACPWHL